MISESGWCRHSGLLEYTITGNRFLRHMVRRLVGTMIHVSAGKISLRVFEEMLSNSSVHSAAHTAPAHGLILKKVSYIK